MKKLFVYLFIFLFAIPTFAQSSLEGFKLKKIVIEEEIIKIDMSLKEMANEKSQSKQKKDDEVKFGQIKLRLERELSQINETIDQMQEDLHSNLLEDKKIMNNPRTAISAEKIIFISDEKSNETKEQ